MRQHRAARQVEGSGPAQEQAGPEADLQALYGNQALLGMRGGPFAPPVQAMLESAFGPEVRDLEVRRGQDAENEALGARANTRGRTVSLSAQVREDVHDKASMDTIGHEVSHALAGGGSGATEVDEAGDPGEAAADKAGEAFARFTATDGREQSGDLKPAAGGRARVHRDRTDGQESTGTSYKDLLATLKTAKKDETRRAAAMALARWCRANLPDRGKLDAYLAGRDKADEKTATLGKLQAALARNEFLLGNAFKGGVDKGSWEEGGANRGAFVDPYLESTGLAGNVKRKDAAWCTSFVGTQVERAGFDFNEGQGGKNGSRSIFWSGSRLEKWGETGKENGGRTLNAVGDRITDAPDGSKLVDATSFKALAKQMKAADDDRAKKAALTTFFKLHPAPRAGDIVVIGKSNDYTGSANSHTLMVERFDAASGTMSLVEGNSDNRVKGRTLSLMSTSDLGKLIYLMRIGVNQYDDPGNTKTGAGPTRGQAAVSADAVLKPVEDVNRDLASLSVASKWVKTTDANATVSEMVSGSKVNPGSDNTR